MQIHHVGIVVSDIEKELPYYVDVFGYQSVGEPVFDEFQQAMVLMLDGEPGQPGIELIAPKNEASPLWAQAKRRGFAHVAFVVQDLDAEIKRLRSHGAMLVSGPSPALLFCDERVAFLFLKTREFIELVEKMPT